MDTPVTQDSSNTFELTLHEASELRVDACDGPLRVGELVQDKYRIEAKLNQGGMGVIFRATNVESGKQVALKWLLKRSSAAGARLSREAYAAAQIDHPNAVNVFDLGVHRGGRFLVMELLRGRSMRDLLEARAASSSESERCLAPVELVNIMLPVLCGLRAAHAAGVIHRDLKPDNIFLCEGADGAPRRPKILDFGISKMRICSEDQGRLTGEGTGIGTPGYMSPEQRIDALDVDERTDIYAAGVTMYEALTGRLPDKAGNFHASVLLGGAQSPVPLRQLNPAVPPELERIVMRAMAQDAAARYEGIDALIAALQSWLRDEEEGRSPRGVRERPFIHRLRGPLRGPLVAAGALLLITLWLLARAAAAPVLPAGITKAAAHARDGAPDSAQREGVERPVGIRRADL